MLHHHARRIGRGFDVGALGGAVALAVALVASPASAQTSTTNRQFVTGSVTSVHGTSVQVNEPAQNSEATVTLSPTTQITKRQSAAATAITTGACVRVLGTGSATKGITARTVALSPASSTGCGPGNGNGRGDPGGPGGFRFGNGQRPNFGNRNANGNANGRFPNGGNFANFALANGPVVSVSGDTVVVKSTTFARRSASTGNSKSNSKTKSKSTKNQSSAPKPTTSNVKVTLTSSTAITQTVSATAADVAVGSCVTATGTTAGAGIDADRVNVSAPVNGACTAGFGGGRFGGNGTGGNANGSGGQV
jgi:hypothetical protein